MWLRGDILIGPGARKAPRLRIEPSAGTHIAALLSAEFLLLALRLWLVDTPNLLYSTTGPLVGASYTDLHAALPALRVLSVVSVIAAVGSDLRRGSTRAGALRLAGDRRLSGRVALSAEDWYRSLMQKFLVAPTELTRETPYLRSHIAGHAAGLGTGQRGDPRADRRDRPHAGGHPSQRGHHRERAALGPRSAAANLRPAAGDPDLLRLRLGGRRPLLDRREVPPGAALAPGAELCVAADPDLHQRAPDLYPRHGAHAGSGEPGDHRGTSGAVHQGPAAGLEHVAQGDPAADLLRRDGQRLRLRRIPGSGSSTILRARRTSTPPTRAAAACRSAICCAGWCCAAQFGSSKILFSRDITNASRVLYNRNIVERARRALPFLRFDRDPYLVVADDGTLKWIARCLHHDRRAIPTPQRLDDGTSYMRNSVKLVIDAYDGIADRLCRARRRIRMHPHLGQGLPRHLRTAGQHAGRSPGSHPLSRQISTGSRPRCTPRITWTTPEDFYHREDQWQIPGGGRGEATVPFMRHIVMRLPEEKNAEYIYMVPFTPRGKDNLAAWMVARNDGAEYGKLGCTGCRGRVWSSVRSRS